MNLISSFNFSFVHSCSSPRSITSRTVVFTVHVVTPYFLNLSSSTSKCAIPICSPVFNFKDPGINFFNSTVPSSSFQLTKPGKTLNRLLYPLLQSSLPSTNSSSGFARYCPSFLLGLTCFVSHFTLAGTQLFLSITIVSVVCTGILVTVLIQFSAPPITYTCSRTLLS